MNSSTTFANIPKQNQSPIDTITYSLSTQNSKTKNTTCSKCPKTFSTKSKLTRHLKEIHNNKKENAEKHPCQYCSKKFKRSQHLQRHTEGIHLGFRYVCHICSHEHVEKSKLKLHLLNVHNLTLCEICGSFDPSNPTLLNCCKPPLKGKVLANKFPKNGVIFECSSCKAYKVREGEVIPHRKDCKKALNKGYPRKSKTRELEKIFKLQVVSDPICPAPLPAKADAKGTAVRIIAATPSEKESVPTKTILEQVTSNLESSKVPEFKTILPPFDKDFEDTDSQDTDRESNLGQENSSEQIYLEFLDFGSEKEAFDLERYLEGGIDERYYTEPIFYTKQESNNLDTCYTS